VVDVRPGGTPFNQSSGEPRLRILVADDNAFVLARVSTLLAKRFDLVGAVRDGRQAVEAARRLDPDVILLDITMPELNGFQVARELTRAGARARIVMLTMHQSDGFVAAAVTAGAQGYVLKTRMLPDLEVAIDHVIAGRLFVPSLVSLLAIAPAPGIGGHSVLAVSDRSGPQALGRLLAAALRRGDVAALVATEAVRAGVTEQLIASGCPIAEATASGRYFSLDVRTALSQVLVGGTVDADRVAAFVDDLERARLAARATSVTIVGEPGQMLWQGGDREAALQLERVWHDATRPHAFLTVCPYAREHGEGADPALVAGLWATHSAACYGDPETDV
jgi:CheY-like chemotaxis protein